MTHEGLTPSPEQRKIDPIQEARKSLVESLRAEDFNGLTYVNRLTQLESALLGDTAKTPREVFSELSLHSMNGASAAGIVGDEFTAEMLSEKEKNYQATLKMFDDSKTNEPVTPTVTADLPSMAKAKAPQASRPEAKSSKSPESVSGNVAVKRREDMGKELKSIRTSLGMTQAEFAKHIGTQATTISNLETGKQTLTQNRIQQIGAALGLLPEDLAAFDQFFNPPQS